MTPNDSCSACGATHSLEYEDSAASRVCTSCGSVDLTSTSESLELLGPAGDGESGAADGRHYLRNGGVRDSRRDQGRSLTNAPQREAYHATRSAQNETFIRSLLTHFGYPSLSERAILLFNLSKSANQFRWGPKARAVAAACVYIASRERGKSLRLVDVATITSIPLGDLSRYQQRVRDWVGGVLPPDIDLSPLLSLLLSHLTTLLSHPSPPLSIPFKPPPRSKKSPQPPQPRLWPPPTLSWLRSIPLSTAHTLSLSLLSFASDLSLHSGRNPEQLACALFLIGLEGVARTVAPHRTDVLGELSAVLSTSPLGALERVKELYGLLGDYATKLPWMVGRGEGLKRKNVVANVGEIVRFRGEIEEKERRKGNEELEKLLREVGEEEEREGKEEEGATPSPPTCDRSTGSTNDSTRSGSPASTITAFTTTHTDTLPTTRLKRPSEYMLPLPGLAKRARTVALAATSLLQAVSPSPSLPLHPPSFSTISDSPTQPPPLFNTHSLTPSHSLPALRARRLLLSGVPSSSIFPHRQSLPSDPVLPKRLHKLLWTKTEPEITDEELFGEGELEAFVRSEEEVRVLEGTQHFREMEDGESGRKGKERKGVDGGEVRGAKPRRSKIDAATRIRLLNVLAGVGGEEVELEEGRGDVEVEVGLGIDVEGEGDGSDSGADEDGEEGLEGEYLDAVEFEEDDYW